MYSKSSSVNDKMKNNIDIELLTVEEWEIVEAYI